MEIALKTFWPAIDRSWKSMRARCSYPACHNTQLMRAIPGGRAGVRTEHSWYCSVDCFAFGSRQALAELSTMRLNESRCIPRMPLGLVLVSRGIVSADQLRYAQQQGKLRHENLETTLLRLELVDEMQLAAARAAQWGYPILARKNSGGPVESDIPLVLLNEFSAVPFEISVKARRIVLGVVFRVEESLLEAIEKITGCRVFPCFISSAEYLEQAKRLAQPRNHHVEFFARPGSPDSMARTLGRCAVQVGAQEATLSECKNFVWVRLGGTKGTTDVIFRFEQAVRGISCDLEADESMEPQPA